MMPASTMPRATAIEAMTRGLPFSDVTSALALVSSAKVAGR